MKSLLFSLIILTTTTLFGQKSPLEAFKPLLDRTWSASGNWGDGTPFEQKVTFSYGPGGKTILAHSEGFTDTQQKNFGWRNHGVRYFDEQNGLTRFWEFDAFGGLTEGDILIDQKNIMYQYQYGDVFMTDLWEYVDASTYKLTVGSYELGVWNEKYLEVTFKAEAKSKSTIPDYGALLEGDWTSTAWDGKLNESWRIEKDGSISQSAEYIVDGEMQYQAQNRIVQVGEELILFTVIKDSNPKIFQATSYNAGQITFENDEYENPSVVKYKFLPNGQFHRTISGMENGIQSSYTFVFKPAK